MTCVHTAHIQVHAYTLNKCTLIEEINPQRSPKSLFLVVFFGQGFGRGGSSLTRCDLRDLLLASGCDEASMEFPSSSLTVVKDKPLSDKASGVADDVTQIKPQRIHMKLRPGEDMFNDSIWWWC